MRYMQLEMMAGKIHRATVTDANLNYIGSITLDKTLMDAAGIIKNQKLQVVNVTNGARIDTYAIEGEADSGIVCLNGAAAHHFDPGDIAIIIAYAHMTRVEAETHEPKVVFVDGDNKIKKTTE